MGSEATKFCSWQPMLALPAGGQVSQHRWLANPYNAAVIGWNQEGMSVWDRRSYVEKRCQSGTVGATWRTEEVSLGQTDLRGNQNCGISLGRTELQDVGWAS